MVPMTHDILNVIHAVLSYRDFIIRHHNVVDKTYSLSFDWYTKTQKYYFGLPLPAEMKKNKQDFEIILSYGIMREDELKVLDNTSSHDLYKFRWK